MCVRVCVCVFLFTQIIYICCNSNETNSIHTHWWYRWDDWSSYIGLISCFDAWQVVLQWNKTKMCIQSFKLRFVNCKYKYRCGFRVYLISIKIPVIKVKLFRCFEKSDYPLLFTFYTLWKRKTKSVWFWVSLFFLPCLEDFKSYFERNTSK